MENQFCARKQAAPNHTTIIPATAHPLYFCTFANAVFVFSKVFGNIGKKVSQIAQAFGMKVICTTRTPKADMPESVAFEELLRRSDFVSLHAPLTPQTTHIINKESLSLMKKSAYLINTARGGFVIEKDLADYLNNDGLAGYAADVLLQEPMASDCPLLKAKNCVITPHIAWASTEARIRLLQVAIDNVRAFLNGHPQNVV